MPDNPYKLLLEKLEDETCALILGPEFMFADRETTDLVKSQKKFLAENNSEAAAFLKPDGFFYKISNDNKPGDRGALGSLISSFTSSSQCMNIIQRSLNFLLKLLYHYPPMILLKELLKKRVSLMNFFFIKKETSIEKIMQKPK